ncbi:hypothetical protein [Nonomuraea sp. NPDC049141]|uniref:DUF7296 family protein n=1 Tax=Nonomuraea sp. NPDC049141 TaxID=3155500 RepID=UPI0033D213F2
MFYTYRQNNSGGVFDFDENGISVYVIVEAESASEADRKGQEIGLYYDGRGDCSCCGNRWSSVADSWYGDSKGDEVPSIYGTPVEQTGDRWPWMGDRPEGFIHYSNGNIDSIRAVGGNFQVETWREVVKAEPKKVYVATSGCYSDYSVEAVFLHKEDAEAYSLADDVLEMILQEGPADVRPNYLATWTKHNGDSDWSYDQLYDGDDTVKATSGKTYLGDPWVRVTGWDKERVLKVLGERKAELLAEMAGVA